MKIQQTHAFISWAGVVLPAVLIMMLGFAVMIGVTFNANHALLEAKKRVHMEDAANFAMSAIEKTGKNALIQAEIVARQPGIAEALLLENRDELQKLSENSYRYLKERAGVSVFGFHTQTMDYLLRMHKLESFGDNMAKTRPMILAANHERQPQTGIEIGVTGIIGIRGITLVQTEETFTGTVEVGIDPQPLLEYSKNAFPNHTDFALILSKRLAKLTEAQLKGAGESIGDNILSATTDTALFTNLLKNNSLVMSDTPTITDVVLEGERLSIFSKPLIDFSAEMIGTLVTVKSFTKHEANAKKSLVDVTLIALGSSIIALMLFIALVANLQARSRSV